MRNLKTLTIIGLLLLIFWGAPVGLTQSQVFTYTPKFISLLTGIVDVPNVNANEVTAYTLTTPANTLASDGDAIEGFCEGALTSSANPKIARIYFGGTAIMTSGNQSPSSGTDYIINITIWRDSSTTIRYAYRFIRGNSATEVFAQGKLTGLTLSGTNVLSHTVQGGASNEITAKACLFKLIPVI